MASPYLVKQARGGALDIAFLEWGPISGRPVILLHGFPYDPLAYAEVGPLLAAQGFRAIAPYLRGFGPTHFRAAETLRSGEQAAIGADLLDLVTALELRRPLIAGYDWGGRAACVAAALAPDRIGGALIVGGYLIQSLADPTRPAPPAIEQLVWHQYYLSTARGTRALREQPAALARHLWRQWSPSWRFTDEALDASARSFANPDFAAVVSHSYAHRIGAVAGDPAYAALEQQLTGRPAIAVPALVLVGEDDPLGGGSGDGFDRLIEVRRLAGVGHNPPQEAPAAFASALVALARQAG